MQISPSLTIYVFDWLYYTTDRTIEQVFSLFFAIHLPPAEDGEFLLYYEKKHCIKKSKNLHLFIQFELIRIFLASLITTDSHSWWPPKWFAVIIIIPFRIHPLCFILSTMTANNFIGLLRDKLTIPSSFLTGCQISNHSTFGIFNSLLFID